MTYLTNHDERGSATRARPGRARALALACASAIALALSGAPPLTHAAAAAPAPAPAASAPKVLRYAFQYAETGFDPAQTNDVFSHEVFDNIFDAPLRFDYLSRPVRLRPNTLTALPEASDDFRHFTLHVRPGIYFADDPAFKGHRRELVAADYAYSIRRHFDPKLNSVVYPDLLTEQILGLEDLREKARQNGTPFDYDTPVPGLQVLDRYTLRINLGRTSPRFTLKLAGTNYAGALAREVVEAYGDAIPEHPVGTGPYRLVQWRRSSFMALERNPGYREETYDEQPPADDPVAQATAARMHGRRLPMIDRVEISIVQEAQPYWLAFVRGDFDVTRVPYEFATLAVPGGKLAPNLAKQGITQRRIVQPDVVFSYFNMEDPVVGGYDPVHVALRRAITLAYDTHEEVRLLRKGLAVAAQGYLLPLTTGYDPTLRSELGTPSLERAKALLDLYGYVDRNGDGWREQPDGSPLEIHAASETDGSVRQFTELWKRRMDALGVRFVFDRRQWPENMKQARAGKLQCWVLSSTADTPDAETSLQLGYGPMKGEGNYERFDLPAFNALYAKIQQMPDGPDRVALIDEAQRLLLAYMPFRPHVHRIRPYLAQPWLFGFDGNPFVYGFWRFLDIDPEAQAAHRKPKAAPASPTP
jgi:ABC-type transport system substrate-binding protein